MHVCVCICMHEWMHMYKYVCRHETCIFYRLYVIIGLIVAYVNTFFVDVPLKTRILSTKGTLEFKVTVIKYFYKFPSK